MIEELDQKKKAALKATWLKVNQDFGGIFSTLLPGTMAKLEPPEGLSYLDGEETSQPLLGSEQPSHFLFAPRLVCLLPHPRPCLLHPSCYRPGDASCVRRCVEGVSD